VSLPPIPCREALVRDDGQTCVELTPDDAARWCAFCLLRQYRAATAKLARVETQDAAADVEAGR
jgi:hypothetical protein